MLLSGNLLFDSVSDFGYQHKTDIRIIHLFESSDDIAGCDAFGVK